MNKIIFDNKMYIIYKYIHSHLLNNYSNDFSNGYVYI